MTTGGPAASEALRLVPEWDELASNVAATPFSCPGWILAWCDAFAPGAHVEFVTVRRSGRLAGVVPLLNGRMRLRAPTNWHTPHFELLAEDEAARSQLCERLLSTRPRSVTLRFLPADAADHLAARATGSKYRVLRRSLPTPIVDLEGLTWADYHRSRRADLRSDVRRRRRRLEGRGEVNVVVYDGSEHLDRLLQEGFALEASGWKGRAGSAIVSNPATHTFYLRVARFAAERGWLRVTFVRVDEQPVAFSLDLECRGTHYNLKGGYDESFRDCSPGKILVAALVERAFATGLRRFEFGGAVEPFKKAWATGTSDAHIVQAFAPTVPGLGEWFAYAVGRPAAKRALEVLHR